MALSPMPTSLPRRLLSRLHRMAFDRKPLFRRLLPLQPFSNVFGSDRGLPIDRYYIERFLGQNRQRIQGVALEVAESMYVDRFGSDVERCDILHYDGSDCESATVIGDLCHPSTLPQNQYDCFVCTQTFQYLYDYEAGIRSTHQLLRPGGTLLATLPTISRRSVADHQDWKEYWRFTPDAVARGFAEVYGEENVQVEAYGNVLAATAFLLGLAKHEIGRRKLDYYDPDYPMLVAVTAYKE
ncbi:MAG: methyltransferase domain-containing protein [Planctomycetota bacterium]